RARLFEKLEAGLEGRVILLSAPAGFGKTTLIADWVRSDPNRPAAWLALDEDDNDPARFWSYFTAALQRLWPEAGREILPILTASRPVPPQAFLTILINEISVAQPSSPSLLVLDDLHLITTAPIREGLTFFTEHMPDPLKLVIGTRADPESLPLARLRARAQLTELRPADLRFTAEEASEFLTRAMKLPLAAADVAALDAQTEGWIAGLQMAALSMQGNPDPAGFIQTFTGNNRFVLDYLLAEVLQREPAEVRSFLLSTSILEQLCAPLCDSLTDGRDGQAMLEHLESSNLFLLPLDQERRWYRYHPLFANLLTRQLREESPGALPGLHRRAADWCEQNNDPGGAIRHALAAQDNERAAQILERIFLDLLARSELGTLIQWLRSLPDETIRGRPWLCVLDAWLYILTGQADQIAARLQDTEAALPGAEISAADQERIRGYIAAVRAQTDFIQGAIPAATAHAGEALAQLTAEDFVISATTALIQGAAFSYAGDFHSAIRSFEQSKALSLAGGNQFNAMLASVALAQITAALGRLRAAYQIYQDGLRLTGASVMLAPGYAFAHLADILREWDRLDEALEYAARGVEMCELLGQADILMTAYTVLARIQRGRGKLEDATATLEKARRVASEISAWSLDSVLLQQARIALVAGNLEDAVRWVMESGYSEEEEPVFHREAGLLTLARVLTAQGRFDAAERLLARIQRSASECGSRSSEIEAGFLRAINFSARDPDDPQAKVELARTLALSEPEGYTRIYLDEGESAAAMIKKLAPESGLAERITHAVPAAPSALPEPLSERELDVLRLLAAGRSNPEIAEALYISLNTVKAHVKSVFAKLGVHNRSQALLRAQELKLI
ncbi:MAG: AAA family ATPase, partial [Anaerolineales bacterium]|nr:AAA family ATPase [Anaerolineales bacterium]